MWSGGTVVGFLKRAYQHATEREGVMKQSLRNCARDQAFEPYASTAFVAL
jgi:hypothetical protein